MKYAIQTRMLFKTKEARDLFFSQMKELFEHTFKDPGTYIQKHLCHHDDYPNLPCVIEEHIK